MNIRLYLVAISLTVIGSWVNAAHAHHLSTDVIDSLKVLVDGSEDAIQADIMNQIGWHYRNVNTDSTMHYAQRGYVMATAVGHQKGISHGLNYMGIALSNQSRYYEAMKLFFEALKVVEKTDNLSQISYTLINIGNIYLYQSNFQGAHQYFERAFRHSQHLEDKRLIAYCYLNLARSHAGLKSYDMAKQYVMKAITLRKELQDDEGLLIAQQDLAKLYILQNENDLALDIILQNINQINKTGHKNTLAYSYVSAAEVYLQKKELEKSLEAAQKSLQICKIHKLKNAEIQTLKILAEIYNQQNKPTIALNTFKQYLDSKDSVYNAENSQKIADVFSKYTYDKSELEKEGLLAKSELNELVIKRQRIIITLSIFLTFSFLIISLVAYRSSTEKKRLNLEVQHQKDVAYRHNSELMDINNEKNNLIRILSHDLRAPINNIKGLAHVHQMDHEGKFSQEDNEVLNMIKSESDRLLNMIKKILNVEAMDDEKKGVSYEKVDINEVAKQLTSHFQNTAASKDITLVSQFLDESVFILGDDVHLHQIMENLLSNALKFTDKGKEISVKLTAKNNKVSVCFKDEGPGLTLEDEAKIFKKFQTLSAKPTGDEESTGLGLSIVKKYVEEMSGKVWYESELGKGTAFYIEFDQITPD